MKKFPFYVSMLRFLMVLSLSVTLAAQVQAPDKSTAADSIFIIAGGSIYHREECPNVSGHALTQINRKEIPSTSAECPVCRPNGYTCWSEQVLWQREGKPVKFYGQLPRCPGEPMRQTTRMNTAASPLIAVTATTQQSCEKEWGTDFRMRAFCETQQRESASTLRQRSMTTTDQQAIRKQCLGEWPTDFRMQNFCEEQQLKALKELGR